MNEIFVIVIVIFIIMIVLSSKDINRKISIRCTLHNWAYDTNNMMFCKVCKKTPEEIDNEQSE